MGRTSMNKYLILKTRKQVFRSYGRYLFRIFELLDKHPLEGQDSFTNKHTILLWWPP